MNVLILFFTHTRTHTHTVTKGFLLPNKKVCNGTLCVWSFHFIVNDLIGDMHECPN